MVGRNRRRVAGMDEYVRVAGEYADRFAIFDLGTFFFVFAVAGIYRGWGCMGIRVEHRYVMPCHYHHIGCAKQLSQPPKLDGHLDAIVVRRPCGDGG